MLNIAESQWLNCVAAWASLRNWFLPLSLRGNLQHLGRRSLLKVKQLNLGFVRIWRTLRNVFCFCFVNQPLLRLKATAVMISHRYFKSETSLKKFIKYNWQFCPRKLFLKAFCLLSVLDHWNKDSNQILVAIIFTSVANFIGKPIFNF